MDWTELENIPLSTLGAITPDQAWHYRAIPFASDSGRLSVYIEDGNGSVIAEELEVLLGKAVETRSIDSNLLSRALSVHYRRGERKGTESVSLEDGDGFLGRLIGEAARLGASDIHMEPYENRCRVRFRMDGALVERFELSIGDYPGWVNRIKIKSNLDIAEKRLPQDGRILHRSSGVETDIRVSILPTLHGEKVVMRLLNNDATDIDLKTLGFDMSDLENYMEGIRNPQGIVLISGPTGSGKTTTLYATLKLLNKSTHNILTIEDPIEYTLEGINQVQLKENIGLDFAAAMRTFLRQDPDVIMVGEIRDRATAEMAIRASLTGHLVLSTIHTNSAWGIVSRLADMGVPSYLLAETLNTAVAQRLVRKLCGHCKSKEPFDKNRLPKRFRPPRELEDHHVPVGCPECHYTGYRGRVAVYEVIPMDRELGGMIKNGIFDIGEGLADRGVKSLSENAFVLLERGTSSLDEVYPILATN